MSYTVEVLQPGYSRAVPGGCRANGSCSLVRGPGLVLLVDTLSAWDRQLLTAQLGDRGVRPDQELAVTSVASLPRVLRLSQDYCASLYLHHTEHVCCYWSGVRLLTLSARTATRTTWATTTCSRGRGCSTWWAGRSTRRISTPTRSCRPGSRSAWRGIR